MVLQRQLPLRLYYNEAKMEGRGEAQGDAADAAAAKPRPDEGEAWSSTELSAALEDPAFWAYSHMIVLVEKVLQDLETLFFSCPCHPERREQMLANISGAERHRPVSDCQMSGRIGAIMATGGWRAELDKLMRLHSAQVVGGTH